MTVIGLRPATVADSEFCFRLHRDALGPYVTEVWGWDEQVQRGFHEDAFDPERWQIITADGADVGMLDVEHRPTEIYVARIEIVPASQGRGIGAELLRRLLREADRQNKDLTLDVLAVNRRAFNLYRRLGLHEVGRHGDNAVKIRMSTRPPHPNPGQES